VLGSKELITGDVHTILRHTGPTLSAFNAWILIKGLETLPLRVRQMTESAGKVADFLGNHPKVKRVIYPHHKSHPQYELAKRQMKAGSTLVAFEVAGQSQAFAVADSLAVILISNNLGDAKSIITHPTTTTHQRLTEADRLDSGITPGLLRLSIGLENADDLIKDLEYGLSQI
jgi:O-succinylhomoserine sulfhydrylase